MPNELHRSKMSMGPAGSSTYSRPILAIGANTSAATTPFGNESPSESALTVSQCLWGRGNLSPLDTILGGTALVKLVPTDSVGFIGIHLGYRLRKYADDTKRPVDGAEAEPTLTRLDAKRKSSINSIEWKPDEPLFKNNRYQTFIVVQATALRAPLEIIYGKAANATKVGGKLFLGDLMESNGVVADSMALNGVGATGEQALHSSDQHISALKSVGLEIECKYDLTTNFLAAVRNGFRQSLTMLEELRTSNENCRNQRTSAYAVQLETWRKMYNLATARKIELIGILATRVK